MEERNQQNIHDKGFDMFNKDLTNYSKVKIGVKSVEDATLRLGRELDKTNKRHLGNKAFIINALTKRDPKVLREISNYFYQTSGIYSRVTNYFSNMYRYDWYIVAEVFENLNKAQNKRIITEFANLLNYLDNSYIKMMCEEIALKVIRDGAYYGYILPNTEQFVLQELPIDYCRSYYRVGHRPVVEFNLRYFDDLFPTHVQRIKMLKFFPPEFQKAYIAYRANKLKESDLPNLEVTFTDDSWYVLDIDRAIKFDMNNNDIPLLVNACPAIIDLEAAQDLDRRKQMQSLLKILVQKLPMDNKGELIFDVDEARDIHNNAVEMLQRAIGVDVLTTFTDVIPINMTDKNTTTTKDDLEKIERTVYNTFGVANNLFNSSSNLALEKSVLNDESYIRYLLLQFNIFFDWVIRQKSSKKNRFRFHMLETTQYNYKEMSKLYKEHTQIGYSKMLPQIALGHSQSAIINTAYFENSILNLSTVMIPPLMSSTLNGEDILGNNNQNSSSNSQSNTNVGRPEKPDDQKSEKTIANNESK